MMKIRRYIYVIVIQLFLVGCNSENNNSHPYTLVPKEEYINYPDSGRYIKYFDGNWNITHYKSKASFYRTAYYKNGIIVVDSLATDFYITGEKQGEAHIFTEQPDKYDGKMLTFYKNGNIESEAHCEYGIPIGEHKGYYENGKRKYKATFRKGKREGLCINYFENGKVSSKVQYKEDERHGTCQFYYENGNTKEIATYINGILVGSYKGYYEDGQVKCIGTYKNGKKLGIWHFYDERGFCTTVDYDRPAINYSQQTYKRKSSSSPQDAYDEGFDSGYEQGYEDGSRGRSFEYGYDDSSSYYDYYEEQYQDGYRNGYEDGYYSGKSRYDDENNEDE